MSAFPVKPFRYTRAVFGYLFGRATKFNYSNCGRPTATFVYPTDTVTYKTVNRTGKIVPLLEESKHLRKQESKWKEGKIVRNVGHSAGGVDV